jgi:hypothetical protein
MVNQKIPIGLATFSSGYMKRWLEGNVYDKIFETELGEKVKGLDEKARYAIEFGLNLLNTFFDQKLAEDTVLKKFVKEVVEDAAPEISKRIINNTKEQLMSNAKSAKDKELVNILLELEDQTLINLLNWFYGIEPSERAKVLKQLSRLSFDEVMRVSQLEPEDRIRLFDIFQPAPSEKFSDKVHSKIKTFNEEWGKGLEQWEKWVDKKKKEKGR